MVGTGAALLAVAGIFSCVVPRECRPADDDQQAIDPLKGPIFREVDDEESIPSSNSTQLHGRQAGSANKPLEGQSYWATNQVTERLMKELKSIRKSDSYKQGIFKVYLYNGKDLYHWLVTVHILPDNTSELYRDMQRLREERSLPDYVVLDITYHLDYPTRPPLIIVPYPRLEKADAEDPYFCHELIPDESWRSDMTSESLIMSAVVNLVERNLRVRFRWTAAHNVPADLRPPARSENAH